MRGWWYEYGYHRSEAARTAASRRDDADRRTRTAREPVSDALLEAAATPEGGRRDSRAGGAVRRAQARRWDHGVRGGAHESAHGGMGRGVHAGGARYSGSSRGLPDERRDRLSAARGGLRYRRLRPDLQAADYGRTALRREFELRDGADQVFDGVAGALFGGDLIVQIGRASCRERV